jgi:phage replication O-like protein O
MANPQTENGHIDIADELAEAFFNLQVSGRQWRLIWVILRKTYGWKKKEDRISVSFFEKKTGLDRWNIHRELKKLIARKIIFKNDNGFIASYGLQKDYSKWITETIIKNDNDKTVVENDNRPLSKLTTKPLSKMTPTKETKETIQKKWPERPSPKALETFLKVKTEEIYQSFPRKADPSNSFKSITRILKNPPPDLICPVGGLMLAVKNNRAKIEAEETEPRYMIQSNNFFGKAERWKDFLNPMESGSATKQSSSYPLTGSLLDQYPPGYIYTQ